MFATHRLTSLSQLTEFGLAVDETISILSLRFTYNTRIPGLLGLAVFDNVKF